jgi:hypothetical protein
MMTTRRACGFGCAVKDGILPGFYRSQADDLTVTAGLAAGQAKKDITSKPKTTQHISRNLVCPSLSLRAG